MRGKMSGARRFFGRAALALCALALSAAASGAPGFSTPQARQILVAGTRVEVRWEAPCRESESSESEVLLSLDGGETFPVRLTPELSGCARGFRWEIPSIATAHARLALRAGAGDEVSDEKLEFVSDEFTIVAGRSAPEDGQFVSGPRERWTRQALSGDIGASLPREAMGTRERLVARAFETDLEPPPPSGLWHPDSWVPAMTGIRADTTAGPRHAFLRSPVPVPLRL